MTDRKITIKDIAAEAGVSTGTVDRVIHNRGGVSNKSLSAVSRAMKTLAYKPYKLIDESLADISKNIKIGISHPQLEDNFWQDIRLGIDRARNMFGSVGLEIIEDHFSLHNIQAQLDSINKLINTDKVDALLITPVNNTFSTYFESNIKNHIPYATVIDDTIGHERAFHIGPNNIALGELMAKIISLYINDKSAQLAILSPAKNVSGSQERISGFLNKSKLDNLDINVLTINTINEIETKEMDVYIYEQTLALTKTHPTLNAIYITYGYGGWVAKAVRDSGNEDKIKVFCHEYTTNMQSYLMNDIIACTITQKAAQQWYKAIEIMYRYISGDEVITNKYIPAECSIITKESLPLVNFNYFL